MGIQGIGAALADLAPYLAQGAAQGQLGGEQARILEQERQRREQLAQQENALRWMGLLEDSAGRQEQNQYRERELKLKEEEGEANRKSREEIAGMTSEDREFNLLGNALRDEKFGLLPPEQKQELLSIYADLAIRRQRRRGVTPGQERLPFPGSVARDETGALKVTAPELKISPRIQAQMDLQKAQTGAAQARTGLIKEQAETARAMRDPNVEKALAMAAALRSLPGYRTETIAVGRERIAAQERMSAAEIAARQSLAALSIASRERIANQINARIQATSDPETLAMLRAAYSFVNDPYNVAGIEMPKTPEQIEAGLVEIRKIAASMGSGGRAAPGTPNPNPSGGPGATAAEMRRLHPKWQGSFGPGDPGPTTTIPGLQPMPVTPGQVQPRPVAKPQPQPQPAGAFSAEQRRLHPDWPAAPAPGKVSIYPIWSPHYHPSQGIPANWAKKAPPKKATDKLSDAELRRKIAEKLMKGGAR